MVKNFIAKLFVLYIFRQKKIFYVSGMRRSGNHAFVNWLTNALEECLTKLKKDESGYLYISPSGKTIFFDEVNKISGIEYLKIVWKLRKKIYDCRTIIISVEDQAVDYKSFRIPRCDEAVFVKRSILNLIASRLRGLKDKAARGYGFPDFNVNTSLLEKITTFQFSNKFRIWSFDKWISSKKYRYEFLKSLNLKEDILPFISSQGKGSSFTKQEKVPESSKLQSRYEQVELPENIIKFFYKDRFRELLSPAEIQYLVDQYQFPDTL